jgi:hypothetical protein
VSTRPYEKHREETCGPREIDQPARKADFSNAVVILTEKQAKAIILMTNSVDSEIFDDLTPDEQELLSDDSQMALRLKLEIAFPQLRKEREEQEFKLFCRQQANQDPRVKAKMKEQREWWTKTPKGMSKSEYWEENQKKGKEWRELLEAVTNEFIASPEKRQAFQDAQKP